MVLGDLSGVDSIEGQKETAITKSGKRKAAILAPWNLPAAKLLRNGKKSPIEEVDTYQELWNYLKHESDHQLYNSEFASEDPIVRGVALSRTAQGIAAYATLSLRRMRIGLNLS